MDLTYVLDANSLYTGIIKTRLQLSNARDSIDLVDKARPHTVTSGSPSVQSMRIAFVAWHLQPTWNIQLFTFWT